MSGAAPVHDGHSLSQALLRRMTQQVLRFPVVTLLLTIGLGCAGTWYTASRLEFKTSRADLINPNADYQKRWLKYTQAFGNLDEMVVVVEAPTPNMIKQVLDDLGPRVERESHLFTNVFYKFDPGCLLPKGLQYVNPQHLQMFLSRLDEYKPLLLRKERWDLLSLGQIFRYNIDKLEDALEKPQESAGDAVERQLQETLQLASSIEHYARDPRSLQSPWPELIPLDGAQREEAAQVRYSLNEQGTMGFLKVHSLESKSNTDFSGSSPPIDRLRELIEETAKRHPEAKLGLTGIPVLESDEMRDSQASMTIASILSFAGVALLLVLGFRGIRYAAFAICMLLVGMAWSFGFTTATVGHLNILSVSFAAMLVGLGIDFAIVYLSRYQQFRHEGLPLGAAVIETAGSVGPGIITAALTTAVAFFAAVFTDFAGVAELGIIAGGGILLCALAALVVLPGVLAVADRHTDERTLPRPHEAQALHLISSRYPRWVIAVSGAGIAGLAFCGLQVKYDYNLLHLQSDGLASVDVQKHIFDKAENSLLFAISLADGPREALELKQKFEALPSVHHVEEIASMMPPFPEADTKLLIQGIHALLANLPDQAPDPGEIDPSVVGGRVEQLEKLLKGLDSPTASLARDSIDKFLNHLHALDFPAQQNLLRNYEKLVTSDLLAKLRGAAASSHPEPVTVADLPRNLSSQMVSSEGKWLLQIYPKSQIWDIEPLAAFIRDVRSVDPDATGTPLQTFEATREIKQSYQDAALYALVAVCILLLVDFRSVTHSLVALLPPLGGAAIMFGILGLAGVDVNPANLIVLPLVLGIGVDGGVHLVHDFRAQAQGGRFQMTNSTVNALLLNATTTMVGFGSMMIARHRGLYSLGLVLTIGVGSCLFVAVVVLPAVLGLMSRSRQRPKRDPQKLLPAPVETFPQPPHASRLEGVAFAGRHDGAP